MADQVHLDLKGLNCPLPVLKTGKALRHLEPMAEELCRISLRAQRDALADGVAEFAVSR